MSTLRGTVTSKSIGKKQIATFANKHEQPPCVCGRATYRLNEKLTEVCSGPCGDIPALCDCEPLLPRKTALIG